MPIIEPAAPSDTVTPTVSEVIRRYWRFLEPKIGDQITDEKARQYRVMHGIAHCRSGHLGAMPFACEGCGYRRLRLRSCGDRHCPTCNGRKRRQWRENLVEWSLDCDYLHLVFTLPHEFNPVIAANPAVLYRLQFRCVTDVLQQTTRRHYGCNVGLVEVLHTWGQQLGMHPHIHVVMTAGGLTPEEDRWVPISADDEVMSREVLAAKFRKTYVRRLKSMFRRGKLDWDEGEGEDVLAKVAAKDWVVNVQKPPPHCQGIGAVINYLGAYVMGGPIGDGRMISDIGGMVTHRFKKYATDEIAYAEVPGAEFVQLFGQHILPPRLARVRCSALYRAQGRRARLEKTQPLIDQAGLAPRACQSETRLLGEEYDEDREESEEETSLGDNPSDCPQCGKELKTKKLDWLDSWQALKLVKIVAGIVVGLRRDGESLLMQIALALLELESRRDLYVSANELRLIESMLVECLDDPCPLLRRFLGRHHPLIRAASEASARAPPGEGESADA